MKKSTVILLLAIILLLPLVASCASADRKDTSDLGLNLKICQEHDGWVYYSDLSSGQLYKIKPSGDEQTEISGVITYSFIINGDRIYYTTENDRALYSCKTDGSDQTFLCDKRYRMWPTHKVYVVEGSIYSIPKYNALFKMKTDGTELTQLTRPIKPITDFCFSDDWIYYVVQDYGECSYNLYRMRTDGTQITRLTQEDCTAIDYHVGFYNDDWIYYGDELGTSIYKVRFDGSDKQKITDRSFTQSRFLKVIGDWVYYVNGGDNSGLYKVKTDGSERTRITDVIPDTQFVSVWDNWLIYMDRSEDRATAHMIRVDDSHNTHALIDEILIDSMPDFEIRKYE